MSVSLKPPTSRLADVLERVLERGILVDARADVSLAGVHLAEVRARIVVAPLAVEPAVRPRVERARPGCGPEPPRRARGRRRASPQVGLACARGCTFRRPPGDAPHGKQVITCPYRRNIACVLRLVAPPAAG